MTDIASTQPEVPLAASVKKRKPVDYGRFKMTTRQFVYALTDTEALSTEIGDGGWELMSQDQYAEMRSAIDSYNNAKGGTVIRVYLDSYVEYEDEAERKPYSCLSFSLFSNDEKVLTNEQVRDLIDLFQPFYNSGNTGSDLLDYFRSHYGADEAVSKKMKKGRALTPPVSNTEKADDN